MDIKHIYWFAPYNLKCPSTRYRGYYPLQFFRKEYGIESDFVFPERTKAGIWNFIKVYFNVLFFRKKESLLVIQKICSNRVYANLLKILVLLRPKNTLYDIDDAEYLRQDVKTLHFFLKKCKKISVGSYSLKDYCTNYNEDVFVLTSPVLGHNEKKKERNKIPNIGWVGDLGNGNDISKAFSHKNNMFTILFPQIKRLKIPITLSLIGVKNKSDIPEIIDYFKNNKNIKIIIPTNLDWENDKWVYSEIKKFDIGVSPLTNHLFNVSKSAFKAKQYLSVGIPTLASNVGENDKFVKHNENGYLCENNGQDFENEIIKISEMSDHKYFEFSNNAINGKKDYAMKNYCDLLIETYKNEI